MMVASIEIPTIQTPVPAFDVQCNVLFKDGRSGDFHVAARGSKLERSLTVERADDPALRSSAGHIKKSLQYISGDQRYPQLVTEQFEWNDGSKGWFMTFVFDTPEARTIPVSVYHNGAGNYAIYASGFCKPDGKGAA